MNLSPEFMKISTVNLLFLVHYTILLPLWVLPVPRRGSKNEELLPFLSPEGGKEGEEEGEEEEEVTACCLKKRVFGLSCCLKELTPKQIAPLAIRKDSFFLSLLSFLSPFLSQRERFFEEVA